MERVLSTNVKLLCKQQGKQLKDLAHEMGIDPASLTRALNGNARLDTIEKIAIALNVNIEYLFRQKKSIEGYIKINGQIYDFHSKKEILQLLDNV